MNRHYPAGERGASVIEAVVSILVVSLLGLFLLDRMLEMQERAEKVALQRTVAMLDAALQLRIGETLAEKGESGLGALALQNPMEWLRPTPSDYLGVRPSTAPDAPPGNWYFDASQRQLVYVVRMKRHFRPMAADVNEVRFRLRAVYGAGNRPGAPANTVVLETVTPFQWF